MKKLLSYRGLMGFIYALVMLLPFSAIALRCAYVTFNKNANQSYSSYQVQQLALIDNVNNLLDNETYYLKPNITAGTSNKLTYQYNYSSINIDWRDYGANDREYIGFRLLKNANTDSNYKVWAYYTANDFQQLTINNADMPSEIIFTLSSVVLTNGTLLGGDIYSYIYRQQTLDNAFDYSLYTFLNENGVGRLNLTNWFVDIFLDNTTHNMLYINYINWYMNYSLLVSCVYLLYLVLMWFITLARRLLTSFDEKGSLNS